jgi:uncharacterized protein YqgV (UPF0045/DUF77 family)
MRITAEMSLYPLHENFVADISAFIDELNARPGLQIVTNQLSTQVRGEFADVTGAINHCLERTMEGGSPLVLVVKYLAADLPIHEPPRVSG